MGLHFLVDLPPDAAYSRAKSAVMGGSASLLLDVICPAEHIADHRFHLKYYRALDRYVSTGIAVGTVPMAIPVDT